MTSLIAILLTICAANPIVQINGPAHNGVSIPIIWHLQQSSLSGDELVLKNNDNDLSIPLQRSLHNPEKIYFIIPQNAIPQSAVLKISVNKRSKPNHEPLFQIEEKQQEHLYLTENDKPVLCYNFGLMTRAGVPESLYRSCYVHPIWGLDGEILTDDFPADHYHHRGLFWSWPNIMIGGKHVDLWALNGVKPRFEKWLYKETGPVCAIIASQNGWYTGDARVAQEDVELVVFKADETGRAIDVTLKITALNQPIILQGETHYSKGYGGLYFRVPAGDRKTITSDSGYHTKDSNMMRMPWADYSGIWHGADKMSGSAIFIPEDHHDYPPGWTIRYYGINGVAWPGTGSYTIEPGESLELQYRVWIHRGDVKQGMVQEAYDAYSLTDLDVMD